MRGLIIRSEPINEILAGKKTWEIRGKPTKIRGTIGLIEKGTGTVVGLCDVVDCLGPLSLAEMRRNIGKHGMSLSDLRSRDGNYETIYAWVLKHARRFKKPVPYRHKAGVIVWHLLPDSLLSRNQSV